VAILSWPSRFIDAGRRSSVPRDGWCSLGMTTRKFAVSFPAELHEHAQRRPDGRRRPVGWTRASPVSGREAELHAISPDQLVGYDDAAGNGPPATDSR